MIDHIIAEDTPIAEPPLNINSELAIIKPKITPKTTPIVEVTSIKGIDINNINTIMIPSVPKISAGFSDIVTNLVVTNCPSENN